MPKSIHIKKYRSICRLLTQAREEAGMTQIELAEKLNKPQSYVSKYERGERRLDILEFISVVECIGLSPTLFIDKIQNSDDK